MTLKATAYKATALIVLGGVAAMGADFGWWPGWGKESLSCQAPGAQTTSLVGDAKVVTAATVGERQGEWLRKLTGPPPSAEDVEGALASVVQGAYVYGLSIQAAARDREQSEYVRKYNEKRRVAKERQLAEHISLCSPCPEYQPGGQPLTVANRSGEAQARAALSAAGFTGQSLEVAVRIAEAESGFNPTAANPNSTARGLMQIMLSAHQNDPEIGNWRDPYANARMAWRISNGGTNWTPWSTWPAVRRQMGIGGAAQVSVTPNQTQTVGADSYTCTLAPGGPNVDNVAWKATHSNGRIPTSQLAHPRTAPNALFRPDAAAAFDRLNTAYKARFGVGITVTDSYRSYASQVDVKGRKPGLAATPGTSDHGWGIAADLGGGIGRFGTVQYQWMKANAPRYGWVHEAWAEPNGSRPEPWHWTHTGGTAA